MEGEVTNGNGTAYRIQEIPLEQSFLELKKWKIFESVPDVFLKQIKTAALGMTWTGVEPHSAAFMITFEEDVYVMGENLHGILGLTQRPVNGQEERISKPKRNEALSKIRFIEFAIGSGFAAGWTSSGKVFTWGRNKYGQLGLKHNLTVSPWPHRVGGELVGEEVIKVVCGGGHSLCLTKDGSVFSWGNDDYGQLGRPSQESSNYSPQLVEFPQDAKIIDISCTGSSSFALTLDGKVFSWGLNAHGQLGDGTTKDSFTPKEISFGEEVIEIQKIACGMRHCLALTRDGSVFGWGWNSHGQVGNNTTEESVLLPVKLESLSDKLVVDIAAVMGWNISVCQTLANVFVWGAVNGENVLEPKETEFKTMEQVFAEYEIGMFANWHSKKVGSELEPELVTLFDDAATKDVTFKVGGKIAGASRRMLERCAYFRTKFQEDWKDVSKEHPIQIDGCNYPEFNAFLKFIHTDEIEVKEEHLIVLLELAHEYGMKLLRKGVALLLEKSMNVDNVVAVYEAAVKCDAQALAVAALEFIGPRFLEIMKKQPHSKKRIAGTLLIELDNFGIFPAYN